MARHGVRLQERCEIHAAAGMALCLWCSRRPERLGIDGALGWLIPVLLLALLWAGAGLAGKSAQRRAVGGMAGKADGVA